MHFLQLPVEIRLNVYSQLFGEGVADAHGGRQDVGSNVKGPSMLPMVQVLPHIPGRGAQLLRTCKVILTEARPLLYKNTIFRSSCYAFAGKLPGQLASDNPTGPLVKHLEWQLNCDLLKRYDASDVYIESDDVRNLQSVQISCQAENWKNAVCGEWYDQEAFINGRQQVVEFAKLLRSKMSSETRLVTLVEDTKHLSRGRVVLRLFEGSYYPLITKFFLRSTDQLYFEHATPAEMPTLNTEADRGDFTWSREQSPNSNLARNPCVDQKFGRKILLVVNKPWSASFRRSRAKKLGTL